MVETWYKNWCSECEAVNWTCNGDESDLSAMDLEGYKCWKCGHIEYIGPDYDFDAEMGCWESIEDCNWELGKEIPK